MSKNADEMLEFAAARSAELAAPGLSPRPQRKVAVLSCMDTRIDLFPMLGLERGDAHIIRNAGGLVTDDAMRSLSASQRLLGTEDIVVVMHEGCGLCTTPPKTTSASSSPTTASCRTAPRRLHDLEATLHHSLERLRTARELPHRDHIRGFIFDPKTGRCARSTRPDRAQARAAGAATRPLRDPPRARRP